MRENPLGGKAVMAMQRYKPEQILTMLRQIEVGIANGKTTPQACKEAAITVQTFYRWQGIRRFENGPGQATKRTGERERQVEAVVAELSLDKQILKDIAEGLCMVRSVFA